MRHHLFPLLAGFSALYLGAGCARAEIPAAPTESDWRTPDAANLLVIYTNKGRIIVELAPEAAPQSAARLRQLARMGVYNGRAFFRVIDNFMDQTGDPLDNGTGDSTLPNLPAEFTFRRGGDTPVTVVNQTEAGEAGFVGSLPVVSQTMSLASLTVDQKVRAWGTFCPGVVGMARSQSPDSANAQFFLMRGAQPNLDQKYTPVGRVILGLDVVRAIKLGEPPIPPADQMLKVRVLADIPPAERPKIQVIDTAGPWFKAEIERLRAKAGGDPSICEIDLPTRSK